MTEHLTLVSNFHIRQNLIKISANISRLNAYCISEENSSKMITILKEKVNFDRQCTERIRPRLE